MIYDTNSYSLFLSELFQHVHTINDHGKHWIEIYFYIFIIKVSKRNNVVTRNNYYKQKKSLSICPNKNRRTFVIKKYHIRLLHLCYHSYHFILSLHADLKNGILAR